MQDHASDAMLAKYAERVAPHVEKFSAADDLASLYGRAASLTDADIQHATQLANGASTPELQAALTKSGFVFNKSDGRGKLAKMMLQFITSRWGSAKRVGLINRNPYDR